MPVDRLHKVLLDHVSIVGILAIGAAPLDPGMENRNENIAQSLNGTEFCTCGWFRCKC